MTTYTSDGDSHFTIEQGCTWELEIDLPMVDGLMLHDGTDRVRWLRGKIKENWKTSEVLATLTEDDGTIVVTADGETENKAIVWIHANVSANFPGGENVVFRFDLYDDSDPAIVSDIAKGTLYVSPGDTE